MLVAQKDLIPLRALSEIAHHAGATSARRRPPTQIALVEQVRQLEQRLGVSLVGRRDDRIELSEMARWLLHDAGSSEVTQRQTLPLADWSDGEGGSAGRDLIDQTMSFAAGLAKASSAMFFWLGPKYEIVDAALHNIDEAQLDLYQSEFIQHDPLRVSRLIETRRTIQTLSNCFELGSPAQDFYASYIRSAGVADEIDFVLAHEGKPFGCLAVIRPIGADRFSPDELDWSSLRIYAQSVLRLHWRVRLAMVRETLVNRNSLLPRELDVVRLIMDGKSNADIAELLGISLATVKVHVANILKKMGVDSRLAVACAINRLMQ